MRRRDLIKLIPATPWAGALLAGIFPWSQSRAGSVQGGTTARKRNLFKELNIRTFINAAGTLTYMTGCLMQDEVVETISSTSKDFCMLDEVQDKVGERIAKMVHAEAATVTSGAFSALTMGLAGLLTGMDLKRVEQLPHLAGTGMKSEVICQKSHDERYNHAFLNTGCTMVLVETVDELENAINEKTALMHFLNIASNHGNIQHEEWVALGKKFNVPTSIDIAADIPPASNLWKFNEMGFDFVCVSGGKAIRGPQSAGLLMGKKHIISAARLNAPPRGFNIARGHKVNKEEILGMYVALEKYLATDHDLEWKSWETGIAQIENVIKRIPGITTEVFIPELGNITPTLTIAWDPRQIKLTGKALRENLRNGNPSIEAGFEGLPLYANQAGSDSIDPAIAETLPGKDLVNITVWMMKPGEEKIVARRLHEEFTKASV